MGGRGGAGGGGSKGGGGGGGSVDDQLRAAYDKLAAHPDAWVKITDLRQAVPGATPEALDAALRRLSQAHDVDMMPEGNAKTLTAADRRHAVPVGGQLAHLIAINRH